MTKILCIEDEAPLREDIVEELRDAGYETIEATNGRDGLDAIVEHAPDLVLCDVAMPVMDGHALVTTLREKYSLYADLPFIFLSALADRTDVIAGKKLGADDYLTKPIDFELLLATVEARLRQVSRMQERKQSQLVKLYKALANETQGSIGDGGEPAAGVVAGGAPQEGGASVELTIVTVAGAKIDLDDIHAALESNGHKIIKMKSGRKFVDSLDKVRPDLVMISYNTSDLPARLVLQLTRRSFYVDFPIVLLVPRGSASALSSDKTAAFDDFIEMPCDNSEVMKKIARLSVA